MGLLDDAIREHLELKRRHGADPSEVARQEQEALGPPRRGAPASEDAEPLAGGAVAAGVAEVDDEFAAEPRVDDERDEEPPPSSRPVGEPEAPVAPPAPADAPPVEHDDAAEREQREEREPPAAPPAEARAPEGQAADDVLEETPEFLQETPEHDRLWFEQKPPRDFDF